MSKNYIIFNGGVSTEPEVNLLVEEFGIPSPGDEFPYTKISEIIGVERDKNRWKSVVGAWRRRLFREHNIILGAVPGEGFRVLEDSDRVTYSAKKFNQGIRRISGSIVVAQKTDRAGLSDEEKRILDHVQDTGLKLRQAAFNEARKLKQLAEHAEALDTDS